MKALRIKEQDGPEVMSFDDIDQPQPAATEVLIKVEAAGINYIDTYQRSGLYQIPLPTTLGLEASGTVEAIGSDVSRFKTGDRVAYTNVLGAHAEYSVVDQDKVVALPDGVSFNEGAAAMLQGCTAHYLSQSTYPIKKGDSCLIHAAAGGVGLISTQMAKNAGASVTGTGTVSTQEKAEPARAAGADEVILYCETEFATEVKRITDGAGVNVVYDSVGKTTFDKSIECLSALATWCFTATRADR
jgi:NADPH2:quinone reductase